MSERLRNKMITSCRLPVACIGKTINCLLFTAYCLLLVNCSSKNETQTVDTYICPMHPTVVSDKQGVCPVCNMDLVRKARPGEEVQITEELARLIKSPNETIVTNIKTVKGEFASLPVRYEGVGVVTYDTRQVFTIPTRVGGRLEKVYFKYPFQQVKRGMKVAEIYSNELVTAQQELFYLLNQKNTDQTLLNDAKSKLELLGITDKQLADLISSGKVQYQFPVYSDFDGYVVAETQSAPAPQATTSMGMGSTVTQLTNTVNMVELIREGDYVGSGQTLFKVINRTTLWVELNLTIEQSEHIQKGDNIELLLDGVYVNAKVDFVQPFYEANPDFVTIRILLPNSNAKVGSLVRARWTKSAPEAMWIPRQAIVDLGDEEIVFVKMRNAFVARRVIIQSRSDNKVSVLGLSSQDEIAANAQFMVDSEGFIKNSK